MCYKITKTLAALADKWSKTLLERNAEYAETVDDLKYDLEISILSPFIYELDSEDITTFDLTLDEALKLFEFPRHLGDYEGKEITVAIGRFGPYVKHDGKFVSIPKTISPAHITLDEAIELIEAKKHEEANRLVKSFDEDPSLQILNGRYGVYISCDKTNYKIPKSVADPSQLTYEECRAIITAQQSKPRRKARS